MPTSIRKSSRNRGKNITGPTRYQHDLFTDPPVIRSRKRKVKSKAVKKGGNDTIIESDDAGTNGPIVSKHPRKNYTKESLYERWVKARTDASKYKETVTDLQKEAFKDKKELEKVYIQLNKERETVDDLQENIDDLKLEKKEEKGKLQTEPLKKPPVSDTERITNMRATYNSLKEKTQYEHKTILCELQFKYDELALHMKSVQDENARLKEEVKFYKKDHTHIKELKVQSLKSEIQISTIRDKNIMK